MPYTEVRKAGSRNKYYRVVSYRKDGKISHQRQYLGTDLSPTDLKTREKRADTILGHPLDALLDKKQRDLLESIRTNHLSKHPATFENRYEAFCSEFAFDSTGIEGNTLTLQETAAVLFEGATPARSLREVYEVLNHKKAFDHILAYTGDVNKALLCDLQRIVTEKTLKPELISQAGVYRNVPVFIRGSSINPPPPQHVPQEMRKLMAWYGKNKNKIHPVVLASYFHSAFEAIHPFVDGNGRAGRLVLNFTLHKHGYPMISIPRSRRLSYFAVLGKAQQGNLTPFIDFVIGLLQKSEKSI